MDNSMKSNKDIYKASGRELKRKSSKEETTLTDAARCSMEYSITNRLKKAAVASDTPIFGLTSLESPDKKRSKGEEFTTDLLPQDKLPEQPYTPFHNDNGGSSSVLQDTNPEISQQTTTDSITSTSITTDSMTSTKTITDDPTKITEVALTNLEQTRMEDQLTRFQKIKCKKSITALLSIIKQNASNYKRDLTRYGIDSHRKEAIEAERIQKTIRELDRVEGQKELKKDIYGVNSNPDPRNWKALDDLFNPMKMEDGREVPKLIGSAELAITLRDTIKKLRDKVNPPPQQQQQELKDKFTIDNPQDQQDYDMFRANKFLLEVNQPHTSDTTITNSTPQSEFTEILTIDNPQDQQDYDISNANKLLSEVNQSYVSDTTITNSTSQILESTFTEPELKRVRDPIP